MSVSAASYLDFEFTRTFSGGEIPASVLNHLTHHCPATLFSERARVALVEAVER